MKAILIIFLLFNMLPALAQAYIVRDIKSFGAKGDGKTNDHAAFVKAALFFNRRQGHGKLTLSKGTYIVGQQIFNKATAGAVFEGVDLLQMISCNNFTIQGLPGSIVRYQDSLRFGAFMPATGLPYRHGNNYFVNYSYVASIGSAISLTNCTDIQLKNITLNGNNGSLIYGGVYGDYGIQIPHIGVFINNSKAIELNTVKANYFGLDGALVRNDSIKSKMGPDKIVFKNCNFEYNSRQGLSLTGCNDFTAIHCTFSHSGKGKSMSPPGAGVDIEAEVGPVSNAGFTDCEFVDNAGCGLVADTGPSRDCTFTNCLFWGTTAWSIWITKPNFTIADSKIYGSVVHGFDASKDEDATKYIGCLFEDKPYKGVEPYGNFLVEVNYVKRMLFENCTMLAHKKKVVWMEASAQLLPAEKFQLKYCRLIYAGNNLPVGDWVCLTRSVLLQNTSFEITHPDAIKKNYWFNGPQELYNTNRGGNKFVTNSIQKSL